MKIGLFCLVENYETSVHGSIKEQIALVELAEELGFDEAWFGEHHFNGFSVIKDLIDKAMLNIYSSRKGSGEISDKLLVCWRVLLRILFEDI